MFPNSESIYGPKSRHRNWTLIPRLRIFRTAWDARVVLIWIKLIVHYSDLIMSAMGSQITGVSIVCSIVCLSSDQRKHQSSASLAWVRENNRRPVDSPHKRPVTRRMFPFDDIIMKMIFSASLNGFVDSVLIIIPSRTENELLIKNVTRCIKNLTNQWVIIYIYSKH